MVELPRILKEPLLVLSQYPKEVRSGSSPISRSNFRGVRPEATVACQKDISSLVDEAREIPSASHRLSDGCGVLAVGSPLH
jgi:hypothetical protein